MLPAPAPPPEGRSTGVCYPFHCMIVSTNSFIGSQRVSHPAARHTRHTQDTVNNRCTQACVVCAQHKCVYSVSFCFRRWRMRQVSRCSRSRLPLPILTASWTPFATGSLSQHRFLHTKLWHSSSLDKRHPAQSKSVSRCNGQKQPNRHLLMNLSKSALAVDKIFLQLPA